MYMQIIEMAANSKPHRETARFAGLCTCFNMRKASRVVTQYFDSVLRPSGLKATQFTLLAAISVTGPAPMSRLADHLILDRTTMTRNLKLLVRQGFVRIGPGPDRRERMVMLTAKGRDAVAAALPYWREAQSGVITRMGEARWRRLLDDLALLGKLNYEA